MRRRRLLAALGTGTLAVAGCTGDDFSDASGTARTTAGRSADETTGTSSSTAAEPDRLAFGEAFETADGRTATVHEVRVRRMALVRGTVHVDPSYPSGNQYVVADASASDRDLLGGFSVGADGERLGDAPNPALVPPDGSGEPAGELLGFPVPAPLDADRAAVVRDGPGDGAARWPLDDAHLDELAHPPEFEVEGFDVPAAVERGASFDATLTVANAGSGDGVFLAELGATTLSDTPEIRVEVPAGETVVVERTVDPHYPEDGDRLPVALNWDADRVARTVRIVD